MYVLALCPKNAGTNATSATTSTTQRIFTIARPALWKGGSSGLCRVLWMAPAKKSTREGIKNTTLKKLSTMPLANTRPRSAPKEKRMKVSATNPARVVSALAETVLSVFRRAVFMAIRASAPPSRSCSKRCSKKME
ncbi:hypothetical protein SDC9_161217 [bioreactor metagenome]|uniref:Uncharacterized protein n=1 Tax=bioreactor metagenome TaxID=1076179 RepID=A0A645FHN0_9ZZZZ